MVGGCSCSGPPWCAGCPDDPIQQKWVKWVKGHERPWPGPGLACGDGGYCLDVDVPPYIPRPPPGVRWSTTVPVPVLVRRTVRRRKRRA